MTSGAADEPGSDMEAGFHVLDVPEARFRTLKCHSGCHGALLRTFPHGDAERRLAAPGDRGGCGYEGVQANRFGGCG